MVRLLVVLGVTSVLALSALAGGNPLLGEWKTPFGVPPWSEIKAEHYLPAVKAAIAQHDAEVAAIVKNAAKPTFANTVEALEDAGVLLDRVSNVFQLVSSAETNEQLQAIARELIPLLSTHNDDVALNPGLFARIKQVYEGRDKLKLNAEQAMLLKKTYLGFVRGGALLDAAGQEAFRKINGELSVLSLRFGDNLLKVTNTYKLVIEDWADLAGLPSSAVAAAAEAAQKAGLAGKWVFTLQTPSLLPFLTYADSRALREKLSQAYLSRCDQGDALDNNAILSRIAALRVQKARLLGYATWADYTLEERMAKTPDKVLALLDQLLTPALAKARLDAADLQSDIDAAHGGFKLAAWDWRYYAEKRKKAHYDLDDETLRPYFSLDHVREGAFYVAERLYGLKFVERKDIPAYHPEVRTFEVRESDGRSLGLLCLDYHPRPGKRGGAWCGALRPQWIEKGQNIRPVVTNVGNFSRPVEGRPALLSLNEVETLFHEFGHALHNLLSQCRYRSLSGTNVAWDFVELPSQIMEHWATEPAVLAVYAKHWQTGEPIPAALVERLKKAETYNQAYETVQLAAASRLDMDWHVLKDSTEQDARAFEKAALTRMGLMPEIPPMHRSPYFRHIFNGGYASGYYSYLWSAVLDCDAFQAFKEKGNLFDPATARSFRQNILSRGGSEEAMTLYLRFRGAEPKVDALLKSRGLK